jgi:single-stranded-DNA-specific exonuclease
MIKTVTTLAALKKVLLQKRGWSQTEFKAKFALSKFTASALGIEPAALTKALAALDWARQKQARVIIFGDYDVDGNCATAITWLGLKAAGLNTIPFIPSRTKHGYGMSVKALQDIFAQGKPDLIITVDNGISAAEALAFCAQEGVKVIVTDHHQRAQAVPALAILQTTQLSGAGVAWFLVWQFLKHQKLPRASEIATELLDLVCLATVVDQVPQQGLNRLLVRQGLLQLRQGQRVGLVALAHAAGLDLARVTGRDLGFGLGPRINAIGRLTESLDALRLLCTGSQKMARQLAQTLDQVNRSRQELTTQMYDLATKQIDAANLPPLIIVSSDQFHEGIIGLLASKLSDEYTRPTIVIAEQEAVCKASCRSVGDFNITDFLALARDDLVSFGGHALAAGFSVTSDQLPVLQTKLLALAKNKIELKNLQLSLEPEALVSLPILTDPALENLLAELEPFGANNHEPLIQTMGKIVRYQLLGDHGQHLKIILRGSAQESELAGLYWQVSDEQRALIKLGQTVTVLGTPKFDHFRGRVTPSLYLSRIVAG